MLMIRERFLLIIVALAEVVDTSRRASTKQAMGDSDPGGSKHPCFFRWVEAC